MSEHVTAKPDIINYKTITTHNGRYRLRRILPANVVSQTINLQATATQLLELKIPARTPFNLARTQIEYQLELPAPGAGKFNWVHDHTVAEIESIKFGNGSGMDLVDLQYASNYLAIARKLDTDYKDYVTHDATSAMYMDNSDLDNLYPPSVTLPAVNAYGLPGVRRIDCVTNHEPVYVRAGKDNAVTVVARSIPLSAFTHTALAMDRDMMSGEELTIAIRVAGHEKLAYVSDDGLDPTTGIGGALNTITPLASAKLTNICLRLAVQVDPMVEAYVRQMFESGHMKFIFPFQYGWKVTAPVGQIAFQHNLTNQFGKKLKRVLTTAFNATEQYSTAFDTNNMDAVKLDLYQTAMDSQPLQDDKISCLQPIAGGARGMDDFRENRHLMKGSVIDNSMAYYLNWFHCDSFSNPSRHSYIPEDNILEGLDLTPGQARTWSFAGTGKIPLSFYTYAEFIRTVQFSPLGPTVITVE